jgi:Putative beta-barrel porin 2
LLPLLPFEAVMRVPLLALCSLTSIAPWQIADAAIASTIADPSMDVVPGAVTPSAASREIVTAIATAPQLRAIATPESIPSQVTSTPDPSITPETSVTAASAPTKASAMLPADMPPAAIAPTHIIPSSAFHGEIPTAVDSGASPQTTTNEMPAPNAEPVALVQAQPAVAIARPQTSVSQTSVSQASVSQSAIDLLPPEQRLAQLSPTDGLTNGLTEPGNNPIDATPEPLDPEDTQAELGEVRILRRPTQQPTPRPQPDVQLLLRSGIFSSSNISALETFQPSDTVFSNTGLLLATPKLGPTTRLVASAGGGAIRFATEGDFNYNVLNFNVGIQQRLTSQMYAQLGWVNEQLYRDGSGQRLLLDNAVDFTVGRQDQLGKQLRLDSFYNLRASFTNPTDQSRVANTLGARLRYDFTPSFQGALDYRLTFKNFTDVDRFDTEHQISATATYSINPNLFIAGSVSYLFGNSSNSAIDVNNLSIGVVVGMNIPFGF